MIQTYISLFYINSQHMSCQALIYVTYHNPFRFFKLFDCINPLLHKGQERLNAGEEDYEDE